MTLPLQKPVLNEGGAWGPLRLLFRAWKHHLRWGRTIRTLVSPTCCTHCLSGSWVEGSSNHSPANCLGLSTMNQQLQAGWESLKFCSSWKEAGKRSWKEGGIVSGVWSPHFAKLGGERVGGVLIQIPQTFLLKLRFAFLIQSKVHLS